MPRNRSDAAPSEPSSAPLSLFGNLPEQTESDVPAAETPKKSAKKGAKTAKKPRSSAKKSEQPEKSEAASLVDTTPGLDLFGVLAEEPVQPEVPTQTEEPAQTAQPEVPTQTEEPAQTALTRPAKPAKSEKSTTPSAAYQVVARRYRPQAFDELIGQETVARALSNAIETNRVGHAYLFAGARGVGKTSCARIFAKALNCVDGPTVRPCLTCDSCVAVSTGDDVDVIEIDGASNRGVDEIRQLRQNATIAPSRSLYKIYIIDEVHMLTREAFNALLKTLEEPPARVKFIFCTTEPNKIPITILSRCQRFDFSGIASGSIAERLAQIAAQEGAEAEDGVFEILARRANGSMRDAQSLLEQLLSFAPTYISQADARGMLGSVDDKKLFDILDATVDGNAARVFEIVADAAALGVDFGVLVEQTLGVYRDLMVVATGCGARELMYSPVARLPELQKIAAEFGMRRILASLQILDQTAQRMRFSAQSRVLAELAFARLCLLDSFQAIETLIERLRAGTLPELGDGRGGPSSSGSALPSVSPETDGKKKNNALTTANASAVRAVSSAAGATPRRVERPNDRSSTPFVSAPAPVPPTPPVANASRRQVEPTPDAPPLDEEPPYFLADSDSLETEVDVSDAFPAPIRPENSEKSSRFTEPPRSFQPPPVVPRVLTKRPTYQTKINEPTPSAQARDVRSTADSDADGAPWLALSPKELADAWLDATRGLGCILPAQAATFCEIKTESPNVFAVYFPGSRRGERNYCEREKERIDAALARRLGASVAVRCLLDPTKTDDAATRVPSDSNGRDGFNGFSGPDSAVSSSRRDSSAPSSGSDRNGFNGGRPSSPGALPAAAPGVRDLYRQLSQNEIVVELRELFEAELAEVKPPRRNVRR